MDPNKDLLAISPIIRSRAETLPEAMGWLGDTYISNIRQRGGPMVSDDGLGVPANLPNSLTFCQKQVNLILGYSLRQVYANVLAAPLPDELEALLVRLEDQAEPELDHGSTRFN
jgi:hypothetical protein